jgi:hydrogenase expression/formation protein HypC
VKVGDYVLTHVGFAIRRIPPEDVERTLAFFQDLAGEELGPQEPERSAS